MYKIKRNGFTLVELMAVIIIISLIALLTFPNIINQIKKTKKSNNKMIEDVVIEQAKKYVSDNDSEYTEDDEYCIPLTKLIDNDYIKEDIVNINDIKDNKVIHLTRTEKDSYEIMDKDKCVIIPTAVKYLLKRANPKTITNYTDGDIHEMYTFDHEATVQTPALRDYRYIGSDPNNYVEFNNELWRIIGVFETEDGTGKYEMRVKIIGEEPLEKIQWNSTNENEWLKSTLQLYLTENYYIDETSQFMISNTKYYLGGITYPYPAGEVLYKLERGLSVQSDRSTSWNGKLSLLYPSDYILTYSLGIDDICYNTPGKCNTGTPASGWLYSNPGWLLSPRSLDTRNSMVVFVNGMIFAYSANTSYKAYPVLYLKSSVKITSGDGTKDNAYKLSM